MHPLMKEYACQHIPGCIDTHHQRLVDPLMGRTSNCCLGLMVLIWKLYIIVYVWGYASPTMGHSDMTVCRCRLVRRHYNAVSRQSLGTLGPFSGTLMSVPRCFKRKYTHIWVKTFHINFNQNKHVKHVKTHMHVSRLTFKCHRTFLENWPPYDFKLSMHTINYLFIIFIMFLDTSEALSTLIHFWGSYNIPHLETFILD